MKLLKRLKKELMIRFTDPLLFYMNKLLELDEKGKGDSLRARALKKKLIKLGYDWDTGDGFFEDDELFVDDDLDAFYNEMKAGLEGLSNDEILKIFFGPRKTSNK